jgi:hypothetical protein
MRSVEETTLALETAEHVLIGIRQAAAESHDTVRELVRLIRTVESDRDRTQAALLDALTLSRAQTFSHGRADRNESSLAFNRY